MLFLTGALMFPIRITESADTDNQAKQSGL